MLGDNAIGTLYQNQTNHIQFLLILTNHKHILLISFSGQT